jgi:hypothetical protein
MPVRPFYLPVQYGLKDVRVRKGLRRLWKEIRFIRRSRLKVVMGPAVANAPNVEGVGIMQQLVLDERNQSY